MKLIYFITHPNVEVNLSIPVDQWDLSDLGRQRLQRMLQQPWIKTIGEVYSSNERKAVTTAEALANSLGVRNTRIKELGEMDRSATGPLPPDEFNLVVDEFFKSINKNIRGWEKAVDVQSRIIDTVSKVLEQSKTRENVAIISHGGVGTMYLCYLKNVPISRKEDQPSQGNYFVFDPGSNKLVSDWKLIES